MTPFELNIRQQDGRHQRIWTLLPALAERLQTPHNGTYRANHYRWGRGPHVRRTQSEREGSCGDRGLRCRVGGWGHDVLQVGWPQHRWSVTERWMSDCPVGCSQIGCPAYVVWNRGCIGLGRGLRVQCRDGYCPGWDGPSSGFDPPSTRYPAERITAQSRSV
jgi:hypothetical protein